MSRKSYGVAYTASNIIKQAEERSQTLYRHFLAFRVDEMASQAVERSEGCFADFPFCRETFADATLKQGQLTRLVFHRIVAESRRRVKTF